MKGEERNNEEKAGLGNVLKLIRIARELSIKDLSEKMGVSPAYISEVEANSKSPSLEMLARFSEALKINRSNILYFDEQGQKNGYNYQQLLYSILQKIIEI